MNHYDTRETAYKNGYEQGQLDVEKKYKSHLKKLVKIYKELEKLIEEVKYYEDAKGY